MESVVRYRAWIVMGVTLLVVVLATLLAQNTRPGSAVTGIGVPRVAFGSQVKQPVSAGRLIYTNGWVATGGGQSIAVYAGRQRSNPHNGLFVIVRSVGAQQRTRQVTVHGSGTLTLLRPAAPASEQAALSENLHFVTANGGTGTLDLSGDGVTLSG